MKFRPVFATLALLVLAGVAHADGIVVTPQLPGWVQVGNQNTWVLPAANCGGTEGLEATCEPPGIFTFNVAFANTFDLGPGQTPPFVAVLDPNGGISDLVSVFNNNGQGTVVILSDPTIPPGLTILGTLCTESDSSGCVFSGSGFSTTGIPITLTFAFDGESSFDPFNSGMDTSDGFKVTTTPEPGSLALLASGLLGLGVLRKRVLA